MPLALDFGDLGEGIGNATAVVRNNAASVGLDAAVPCRPGWTMRDLIVNLSTVHRRATAEQRGESAPTPQELQAEAAASEDLLDWLDDGMVELLNALAAAPEGRPAWHLRGDAPAGRQQAARRLCHHTTLHAVDAMACRLSRLPRTDEVWFSGALARDGIDLLLHDVVANSGSTSAGVLQVSTESGDIVWRVSLGPEGKVAQDGSVDPTEPADALLVGSSSGLYLSLNGRGQDWQRSGDATLIETTLALVQAALTVGAESQ